MSDDAGEVEVVRITLPITCEACGETTRLRLNVEQAERLARGLQAAAAGMAVTGTFEVRGSG